MSVDKPGQIVSIQWLRGIAALSVVVTHLSQTASKYHIDLDRFTDLTWGSAGVDLFFCISGFIMVFTTRNALHGPSAAGEFWLHRVRRIGPLYWILTTIVILIALLTPSVTEYRPSFWHAAASYLFIPWADTRGFVEPPIRVGWSLNFEAYFYLVFGLALMLPARWFRLVLVIWAVGSVTLGALLVPTSPIFAMATNQLLLEFAAGALIGLMWLDGRDLPLRLAFVGLPLGFATIWAAQQWMPELPQVVKYGIASSLILASSVAIERRWPSLFAWRWPVHLGDWSYALYLTHVLTIAACGQLIAASGFYRYLPPVPLVILLIVAAIVVSAGMYLFVEKPLRVGFESHEARAMRRTRSDLTGLF